MAAQKLCLLHCSFPLGQQRQVNSFADMKRSAQIEGAGSHSSTSSEEENKVDRTWIMRAKFSVF